MELISILAVLLAFSALQISACTATYVVEHTTNPQCYIVTKSRNVNEMSNAYTDTNSNDISPCSICPPSKILSYKEASYPALPCCRLLCNRMIEATELHLQPSNNTSDDQRQKRTLDPEGGNDVHCICCQQTDGPSISCSCDRLGQAEFREHFAVIETKDMRTKWQSGSIWESFLFPFSCTFSNVLVISGLLVLSLFLISQALLWDMARIKRNLDAHHRQQDLEEAGLLEKWMQVELTGQRREETRHEEWPW